MSRGYSKVYNKKVNNVPQASIQFDKYLNENRNRPSAAQSAATVGKWGVISCTSIRNSNFISAHKDERIDSKRKRIENKPIPGSTQDPFSFESDAEYQGKGTGASYPKPKKFFKSRNTDTIAQDSRSNVLIDGHCNSNYQDLQKKLSKSKKFFKSNKTTSVSESNEENRESSSKHISKTTKEENKPPIVLRIVKGTSHLVNGSSELNPCVQDTVIIADNKVLGSNERNKQQTVPSITKIPKKINDIDNDQNESYQGYLRLSSMPSEETQIQQNIRVDTTTQKIYIKRVSLTKETQDKDMFHNIYNENLETTDSINEEEDEEEEEEEEIDEEDKQCEDFKMEVSESIFKENSEDHSRLSGENALLTNILQETDECIEGRDVNNLEEETIAPLFNVSHLSESNDDPLFKESSGRSLSRTSSQSTLITDLMPDPIELEMATLHAENQEEGFSEETNKLKLSYLDIDKKTAEKPADWLCDSDASNSVEDQMINTTETRVSQEINENDFDLKDEIKTTTIKIPRLNEKTLGKKKGSIFKSRNNDDRSKKRLAIYKHKWSDDAGGKNRTPSKETAATSQDISDWDEEYPPPLIRVSTRTVTHNDSTDQLEEEEITSIKCPRKAKGFYTVVRNVKKAHQIQESGEFQEFNDDVEYILDALQDTYPIGTRCLSAITLASKCMAPAFRMHVRAHGTVTKFFRALHDATKDQSLGLCTATVMFVLSQDRLNMDLDKHSLELMLNLLESDVSHHNALDDCGMTSSQLLKNKQKVRELCEEIQNQGHAIHLNLDNITVGHLAMETLLSLTSRRAGEWFKEELRVLGGLEHIIKTICECCRQVDRLITEWTQQLLDKLRKVDRCLKVLENVTYQNEENQMYLLKYNNGILIDQLVRLYQQCQNEMTNFPITDPTDKESTGVVFRELLLTVLKVLINLTHDFHNESYGSMIAGAKDGIIDISLRILLTVRNYVPEEKQFDLNVLALILLINLCEHSLQNRELLFRAKSPFASDDIFTDNKLTAVQSLISLFYQQEDLAKAEEIQTDAILDGKKDQREPEPETSKSQSHEEFIEETVQKLLQKAGRNMEHTLISAYAGLLLGYLIIDNDEYENYVRQCLPENNFKAMLMVLRKVLNFMNLTALAIGSSRGMAQIQKVINYLTTSDKRHSDETETAVSDNS